MYAKFEIKVLNNSRLIRAFEMMFAVIIFIDVRWTVIPSEKYQRYLIRKRKLLSLDFFS